MTTVPSINLDKLRHAVQKFGSHSFTTRQLITDYHHGEAVPADSSRLLEDALHQHATLLGICAQPGADSAPNPAADTVWIAV